MGAVGTIRANRGDCGIAAKGLLAIVISIVMAASLCFVGCTSATSSSTAHRTEDGKTIVRVSMYNSSSFPEWRSYVEQQCPDVYIQWEDNRNICSNVVYQAQHGDMPDIVAIRKFDTDSARKLEPYLADLSGLALTQTFKEEYLAPFRDNGKQYWLPEPGTVEGMWANKTLFDQYGIALPTDFDSFVAACKQMKQNGKTPLAVSCTQGYSCVALIEGFGSAGFLKTPDGISWRQAFDAGMTTAVDAQGFSEIAATLRTLVDNGILTEEDLAMSPTTVSSQINSGQAAIGIKASDGFTNLSNSYEFVALPYFGQTSDDSSLFTYPSFSLALSQEAKTDPTRSSACEKVLTTMMDADAQSLLGAGNMGFISYNKDIMLDVGTSMMTVRPLIEQDRCYIRSINSNTFPASIKAISAIVHDGADATEFESVLNENLFKIVEPKTVGTSRISADNSLDTNLCSPAASVLAQTLCAQTGSDFSIIDTREVASPIYQGTYTDADVAAVVLSGDVYTGTLTGAEMKTLIKSCLLDSTTFHQGNTEPIIDYPALAGLTVRMEKDGTVTSVSTDSGALLSDGDSYTVSISSRIMNAMKEDGSQLAGGFKKQDKGLAACLSASLASSDGLPKAREYYDVG